MALSEKLKQQISETVQTQGFTGEFYTLESYANIKELHTIIEDEDVLVGNFLQDDENSLKDFLLSHNAYIKTSDQGSVDSSGSINDLKNKIILNSENDAEANDTHITIDVSNIPYVPVSKCASVDTSIPKSQRYEVMKALSTITRKVTDIDFFVANALGYDPVTMCSKGYFSGEQVDALAMAVFNFKYKNRGMIIGDQAGVGKGRIAAGMMRFAKFNDYFPIFVTVTPNLFSDIYRDMKDIGADDLIPIALLEKDGNGDPIVKLSEKKPAEEDIIRKIISDINNDSFDVSGIDIEVIKSELESDDEGGGMPELKKAIEFYKENNIVDKIIVEKQVFKKNKDFDTQIKNATRMVPFIMASSQKSKDAEIKDKKGNVIYVAPTGEERKRVYDTGDIQGYNCIVTTYSQLAPGAGYTKRMEFLSKALSGKKPFLIFDESHKASGSSGTGATATDLINHSQGRAVFLSATYAKRPDNMPLYAASTSIQDAGLYKEALINAFNTFGVPLQEAVSASLVREGEYVRRQRTYEGIDVDYMVMNEQMANIGFNRKEEHYALANQTTTVIRELINFQKSLLIHG